MENSTKTLPTTMIMIMAFIIIIIITVQNVGDLMVDAASWDEVETLQVYEERREAKMEAISGEDESEKKEAFMLERFRSLLGISRLKTHGKPSKGGWENGSPVPAPSPSTIEAEAEAPAPAPAPAPVHAAASAARVKSHHHQPPRPRPMLPIQKFGNQHKENSRRKNIMIAALVSTGVAIMICALGLLWFSRIWHRQQKGATRKTSLCGDISSQPLARKVRHDPGFDHCYLNTETTALEQQACLKETFDSLNTSAENTNSASHERKVSGDQATKCEPRENNSFSAEEIILVHEYAESSKYESDGQNSPNGDNVIRNDSNLSGDESFHSVCDSRSSSNVRLSNASWGSFSDPVEVFSPNQSDRAPSSPTTDIASNTSPGINLPSNPPQSALEKPQPTAGIAYTPNCQHDDKQPPTPPQSCPPPPPPPPPFMCFIPSHPSYATRAKQTSSPGNSDTPLGSNRASGDNMPSPSTAPTAPEALSNIPPPPCPPAFLNKSINSLKGPPPPPCPPAFLNKSINSLKGPPPPPGQPPLFIPMGNDGAPLPKLKPLHWDKVRTAPDRCMVWDKLRCSSFELDEETIETLFGYNLKTAFKNEEGKSKSPSPSKHVLEPKRLQNITILSKALNVTAEKVCEALVQGDGLCSQQLEALVKMAPTKEEEAKLSSYKGDINELGSAEKLVKEMLTIPHAFQRIETMLYRATFDDELVHLRNSFSMLEEACKELRSSRLFLKLLEAVLKTGNRMNVGTIRGGARAFKLDALLKLADVKGTDGKTTLLHFVVQEMIRSEGIRMSDSIMGQIDRNSKSRTFEETEDDYRRMGLDLVSGLSTELCNVKRTASIDLDVLATSVSNLSDGLSKLQQLVNNTMFKDAPNDTFFHAMKTFLIHAEKNLKELQAEEDKVLLSVRQITEYYHGDVSKDEANPLRIFVIVRDFMGMLDQVCRELKSLKTPKAPNPLAPFR